MVDYSYCSKWLAVFKPLLTQQQGHVQAPSQCCRGCVYVYSMPRQPVLRTETSEPTVATVCVKSVHHLCSSQGSVTMLG